MRLLGQPIPRFHASSRSSWINNVMSRFDRDVWNTPGKTRERLTILWQIARCVEESSCDGAAVPIAVLHAIETLRGVSSSSSSETFDEWRPSLETLLDSLRGTRLVLRARACSEGSDASTLLKPNLLHGDCLPETIRAIPRPDEANEAGVAMRSPDTIDASARKGEKYDIKTSTGTVT